MDAERGGSKRGLLADGKATKDEKRRKWEAKQARAQTEQRKEAARQDWIERNREFACAVSKEDAELVLTSSHPDTALGEALKPYINIQDRPIDENLFIAEGTETVRLLLNQICKPKLREEPFRLKSIFAKPSVIFDEPVLLLNDVEQAATASSSRKPVENQNVFKVIIGSEKVLSSVVGFHMVRGVLACGERPLHRDEDWLDSFILRQHGEKQGRLRILALDGICDTSNMGSMIRSASAFGIDAVVLSNDCCDAWYRRSIRVSMGHVFLVPTIRVNNLADTIKKWTSHSTSPVISYAAVIDPDADFILEDMSRGDVPNKWALVMGNEGNGISKQVAASCSKRIRIKMVNGVDSLSVPIATGILLHGLQEREN